MTGNQAQLKLFGGERAPRNDQLLLGTCSWSGEGWVGSFYPPGSKPADFLPLYAEKFRTVEVDSTFYGTPAANTVKQWRDRTPNGFTFAAKVPQIITHHKVLRDAERDLNDFLSVIDLLGDRLGPLLLQFPYMNREKFPALDFFLERLEPFLDQLPKQYQWAVEIRNKGWLSEKLYTALRQQGVALALVDHPWMPRPQEYFDLGDPITANFSYIRWLGDRKSIEEQTTRWERVIVNRENEMEEWIRVIRQMLKRGINILGFFNNHYAGWGPGSVDVFNKVWRSSVMTDPDPRPRS